jgi:hypothetical protein
LIADFGLRRDEPTAADYDGDGPSELRLTLDYLTGKIFLVLEPQQLKV